MDCSLNECGVCASESVVAFCEICNFRICETCFQLHKKSTKLFQNHVAFLIDTTKTILNESIQGDHAHEDSKESLGDINTYKCSTHTTENLVFFCIEHTETLCGRCVFSCHKSCKVVDLFEVNVDDEEVHACKSHLQNLVENLKSNENKIEKNTYENNACKLEFLKDLQQLRTDVIAKFDRLLSKCEQQCSDTFERNAERLTQVRTFNQEHIKRFQERQELIDSLLTRNHVKQLYVLLYKIKQEIEEIQLKINLLNSEITFNGYVFRRSSGIEELLNSRTFEIGGLEECCSGSDEILDETLSSLTAGNKEIDEQKEAMMAQPDTIEIACQSGKAKDNNSFPNMPTNNDFASNIQKNSGQEAHLQKIKIETQVKGSKSDTVAQTEKRFNGKYLIVKIMEKWCLRDISTKRLYPQMCIIASSVEFKSEDCLVVDGVDYQLLINSNDEPILKKC